MRCHLDKKTTVITGGASGIGFALAKVALQKNHVVFIADIEQDALKRALCELAALGDVVGTTLDVTDTLRVHAFADTVFNETGHVDYLFNNAGIAGALGFIWETPLDLLRHVFEVNVIGIMHCLQAFVPRILALDRPAHLINMSSTAGVTTLPCFGQYQISKHSVVTLTESLHHELALLTGKVKASVVCPGLVATRIGESSRNYPQVLREKLQQQNRHSVSQQWLNACLSGLQQGADPLHVAQTIFKQVEENLFYIFPQADILHNVKARQDAMCSGTCAPMPAYLGP